MGDESNISSDSGLCKSELHAALGRMLDASWKEWDNKSVYEWRVTLATWGMLLLIAIGRTRIPSLDETLLYALAVFATLLVVLHVVFLFYVHNRLLQYRVECNSLWNKMASIVPLLNSNHLRPDNMYKRSKIMVLQIIVSASFLSLTLISLHSGQNPSEPKEERDDPKRAEATSYQAVRTIGPFEACQHDLTTSSGVASIDSLVRSFDSLHSNHTIVGILLVGSTDKRSLRPQPMKVYGSNLGLASARANWVKEKLLKECSGYIDSTTIAVVIGGPSNVAPLLTTAELSEDRVVYCFVLLETRS